MKRLAYFVSKLGLVAIAAAMVAIVFGIVDKSIKNVVARDSFITAFGGAAFAYLFVKYGELFTRLSQREKLNVDTIVSLEYLLNKHLNMIGTNLDVADKMIDALKKKQPVHFLEFKEIPIGPIRLQDLKNVNFINDVFNYFADIEKINYDLNALQKFAEKLMDDVLKRQGQQTLQENAVFQAVYTANSTTLINQLGEIKGFIEAADKTLDELMGKIGYVKKHRAWWLSVAVPWFSTTHYDEKKLKAELPGYIAEFKKGQQENIEASIKEISKIKTKKKN